jgi:hypothetical protein
LLKIYGGKVRTSFAVLEILGDYDGVLAKYHVHNDGSKDHLVKHMMYSILILLQLCSILAVILASGAVLPKQVTGDSITGAQI